VKRYLLLSALLISAFNSVAQSDLSEYNQSSKVAIKQLAQSLQKEMKAAMVSGGPIKAIKICNTRALPITKMINQNISGEISRVSLKNRNPDNMPDEWERKTLNLFENRKQDGALINHLVYSEIVQESDGKYFRMLKAIPTSEQCLACHGKNIAPQVANKINALYPQDKAKNFSVGDIRGAFSIKRKL